MLWISAMAPQAPGIYSFPLVKSISRQNKDLTCSLFHPHYCPINLVPFLLRNALVFSFLFNKVLPVRKDEQDGLYGAWDH
jgi:hypothetical protein